MVMPVILVDSTNGAASDAACSGAGPTTAVIGTAASVGATATSVSITDAVNLSGVATDGSAVLYYVDTTAGHRRFDQITGISGSSGAWTVTVANGFSTTTGPFSWAIGGVRATFSGSVSALLFNNNSAAGDAMPGWTVQMQSGHVETWPVGGASLVWQRAGDTTNGFITLQGDPLASTRPVINVTSTSSSTADVFIFNQDYCKLANFDMVRAGSGPGSSAISCGGNRQSIVNVNILGSATAQWYAGIHGAHNLNNCLIRNCKITYCGANGFGFGGSISAQGSGVVDACTVLNCFGGIGWAIYQGGVSIVNCVVANSTNGHGIEITTFNGGNFGPLRIERCTVDSCLDDGIHFDAVITLTDIFIASNQLTNNGGYGLHFLDTDAQVTLFTSVLNNNTHGNTSGAYKSATGTYGPGTCPWASGDPGVDPQYVNAVGGDYTPQNAAVQAAYPSTIGAATSHGWIGAVQPAASAGTPAVQSLILQPTSTY